MSDDPLAAIVPKKEGEEAIAALREEGVYDDSRSVREAGSDALALPVIRPPKGTEVHEVIRQPDPEPRAPGLADLLAERGWDDAEIERAPKSWAVIGSVILADFGGCPREREIGEALLELHGGADTVLAREGISGEHREPSVRAVAGAGDTETVHTEHGTEYALDLSKVMFSPGNKAERARMGEVVEQGERVLDMFAGIGYFTLPMARAGAGVTAVERNPVAFRYLLENAVLNGVEERIDAYRADCRDVEVQGIDRVVMGYYEAHDYLPAALEALGDGSVLHMHEATPEAELWERPVSRLREAGKTAGRDVEVLDERRVKSHSAGVAHVVVDARIGRSR
ncbi:tRNA wyosine derivatives biosynthesis protein Taw2 [Halalkalicoccus paucihalophilus]|uniref:tRNA(Phe) (4-demethylwyosine(37)-C(7)) aminocarboxypropyltransferase n=1 Tax=Halalkalicoccus paucihalophilus TaxID=1008153 RepID=A0A151AGT9_9EURY|nr:class I SAM-dependent methyltransferase family protein [Halalkalicoccus paucihalophilus]KYH26889.1 tRNA wyosine derivatives biosynthesis protein Taw2 [Halalkalicoccus paucihalophilus]